MGKKLYCGSLGKERAGKGEQAQDRLVCMIPGPWGGGAAGVTRTGGQWPREWEPRRGEVGMQLCTGWFVCER